MPDLQWDDVKAFFDPDLMGALPDVSVVDASVEDWQAAFDLVRSSGWVWEYRVGDVVAPLSPAADVFARAADADSVELRVRLVSGVLVIFRPYSAVRIDFDVDLREFHGQAGVDLLCDLLGMIGRMLGKRVLMCAEGDHENPVLGFDPAADRVVRLAEPRQ